MSLQLKFSNWKKRKAIERNQANEKPWEETEERTGIRIPA